MKRYGTVIEVKGDRVAEYKKLHAEAWPEVLRMITECNIRNYTIFLREFPDGKQYLFSYFEYTGEDFDADSAKMAANPVMQKWWDVCMSCHEPFADREPGEWWVSMEEVFHCD